MKDSRITKRSKSRTVARQPRIRTGNARGIAIGRLSGGLAAAAGLFVSNSPELIARLPWRAVVGVLTMPWTGALVSLGGVMLAETLASRQTHSDGSTSSMATANAAGTAETMSYAELIDLFKHWDSRVSHQEAVFFPATLVPLAGVLVSWKDLGKPAGFGAITGAAVVSLLIYVSYLITLRRIGAFQDRIFTRIEVLRPGFHSTILHSPERSVGMRTLRVLGLPCLASVWSFLLFKLTSAAPTTLDGADCWLVAMPLLVAAAFTRRLLRHTRNY